MTIENTIKALLKQKEAKRESARQPRPTPAEAQAFLTSLVSLPVNPHTITQDVSCPGSKKPINLRVEAVQESTFGMPPIISVSAQCGNCNKPIRIIKGPKQKWVAPGL